MSDFQFDNPYVSLEDPEERDFAVSDPKGFLRRFPEGAVLDEIQRAPTLLSYLQGIVDAGPSPGRFILTGSRQFDLMHAVSQTLAGKTALVHLLPFSISELTGRKPADPLIDTPARPTKQPPEPLETILHQGLYPRIV